MFQPLPDRPAAPFGGSLFGDLAITLEAISNGEQPLRRILAAVEHHILARLAQFRLDRVINVELARVDDAHVHARRDRVVAAHRMHRPAHWPVAATRTTQVCFSDGRLEAPTSEIKLLIR